MVNLKHLRFHVGSLGGLMALKHGQCHLAGSHLLDPASGVYNRKAIEDNLDEPMEPPCKGVATPVCVYPLIPL